MSVPWLLMVLADLKDIHPALAGRLKAAALQLLPPLLDGLHARRLSSTLNGGESEERLRKRLCNNMGVRTGTAHFTMSTSPAQADTKTCVISAHGVVYTALRLGAHRRCNLAHGIAPYGMWGNMNLQSGS